MHTDEERKTYLRQAFNLPKETKIDWGYFFENESELDDFLAGVERHPKVMEAFDKAVDTGVLVNFTKLIYDAR